MKDPTHDEMYDFLLAQCQGPDGVDGVHFDEASLRFDIEEAIYWFAHNYYNGQSSDLYAVLCQSEFNPGALARGPSDPYLYDMLVAEYGQD